LAKLPIPVAVCVAFFDTAAGTFAEEAIFRGLIQKTILRLSFLKRLNPWFAITVQAVLFGLAHGLPASALPLASPVIVGFFFTYPALMGGLLGYISYRHRSLFPVWYMHWVGNFIAAIITIFGIL
jgi:membrane protease YdiL (CAAX protease family)